MWAPGGPATGEGCAPGQPAPAGATFRAAPPAGAGCPPPETRRTSLPARGGRSRENGESPVFRREPEDPSFPGGKHTARPSPGRRRTGPPSGSHAPERRPRRKPPSCGRHRPHGPRPAPSARPLRRPPAYNGSPEQVKPARHAAVTMAMVPIRPNRQPPLGPVGRVPVSVQESGPTLRRLAADPVADRPLQRLVR